MHPFLANSYLGYMAGYVGREIKERPTVLLGLNWHWLKALVTDSQILYNTRPRTPETVEDKMIANQGSVEAFVMEKFGRDIIG